MGKFFSWVDWLLLRTYCVWFPLALVVAVLFVWIFFPKHALRIRNIISFIMQIVGSIIFIIILNQNIVIVRNSSFYFEARNWWDERPSNRKDATLVMAGVESYSETGSMAGRMRKIGNTTEERLKILEGEVEYLREKNLEDIRLIKNIINNNKIDYDNKFTNIDSSVDRINKLLDGTIVGGYKLQLFATLLIIFGLGLTILPIKSPS